MITSRSDVRPKAQQSWGAVTRSPEVMVGQKPTPDYPRL